MDEIGLIQRKPYTYRSVLELLILSGSGSTTYLRHIKVEIHIEILPQGVHQC